LLRAHYLNIETTKGNTAGAKYELMAKMKSGIVW